MKTIGFAIFLVVSLSSTQKIFSQNDRVYKTRIEYKGAPGSNIPDSAKAFLGSSLIAEAKVVKVIKQSAGPNHVIIEEKQYSPSGKIIYKGQIEICFGEGDRNKTVIKETEIFGVKAYDVFVRWPCKNYFAI